MSMYGRTIWSVPVPPFGTLRKTAVCFTGLHAYMFGGAIAVGGIFLGAAGGAVIGFLVALVTGPEVVTKVVAAGLGAKIGAALGALFAAVNLIGGKCTCPGWFNYAFCVCILWYRGHPALPFFPIMMWPCPSECAIQVPPGCP